LIARLAGRQAKAFMKSALMGATSLSIKLTGPQLASEGGGATPVRKTVSWAKLLAEESNI
jgi:hypothetical protein